MNLEVIKAVWTPLVAARHAWATVSKSSAMYARFEVVRFFAKSVMAASMERFRIHRTDVPRHAFLQQDIVRSAGRVPQKALRHRRA